MLRSRFRADRMHGLRGVRKSRFQTNRHFAGRKVRAKISVAYLRTFSFVQGTCGYKVYKCAMYDLSYRAKRVFPVIVALPIVRSVSICVPWVSAGFLDNP